MFKTYLGDGVFVDFDGRVLTLTTESGVTVTNTIILEPEIYSSLVQFVERLDVMREDKRRRVFGGEEER